jgi:2,3-bisphosphoglycerate-independent phosphoglycerate mutase
VSPHQAATLLRLLEREWEGTPVRFGTVSGRLWAMDRDGRWERTERFYRAVVQGLGAVADDAAAAVEAGYAAGVTDEFLEPTVIGDPTEGRIRTGDELVFFNFRPDRARQVCAALADPEFDGFDRVDAPLPFLTAMTTYWTGQPGAVAFGPERPTDVLADVLEAAGVPQLHAAETEKYPHVTYFFNGGVEDEHEGEERILVPSPREVRTYDEKPEMSARELTAQAVAALGTGRYGFAILNFANPDMVGHTGVIPAVIDAVQVVDACLGEVLGTVGELGGVALVTADHGNAERMIDDDGSPHTAHTTNPVPLVLVGDDRPLRDGGRLGDLAPTVLDLLGLTAPAVMTGRSLLGSPATL